jgi:acyl carrier protein
VNIQAELINYIQNQLAAGKAQIGADTSLTDVIDSTAVMELVVWIEDKFGFAVELDDIEPSHFGSVAKLAAYIEPRKKKG